MAIGLTREMVYAELLRKVEHDYDATQVHIATWYAFAVALNMNEQIAGINRAIVDRWSRVGLNKIKSMAWAIADELKRLSLFVDFDMVDNGRTR